VATLGKAVFITPLYISLAWTLLISYQLFTETAVTTIVTQINSFIPAIGFWLTARVDMVVFVYAFAWIFVLSSVIPALLLGKERGVLVQFIVCMTLTFLAFALLDVLENYAGTSLAQMLSFAFIFSNPILAGLYLALPYIVMIGLDVRSRRRNKAKKALADLMETYVDSEEWMEQNYQEAR
jgi:signal transduction histidine kinase